MHPALRSPSRLVDLKLKKAPLPDSRAPSRFNQLTARQPSAAIFSVRMVTTRAPLVANPRGSPPEQPGGDQPDARLCPFSRRRHSQAKGEHRRRYPALQGDQRLASAPTPRRPLPPIPFPPPPP